MYLVPVSRSTPDVLRSFERFFDDGFDNYAGLRHPGNSGNAASQRPPAIHVTETDKAYVVTAELPGATKDNVKVSIDGRRVTIQANLDKPTGKNEGERTLYTELNHADFSRTFTVPEEIDENSSSAKLENGVLTLTLNKRSKQPGAHLKIN